MSRTVPRSFALPAGALDRPDPEIALASLPGRLDPVAVFGREGPLVVEVGYGKGGFLLAAATAAPDTNFLGIERAKPFARLVRHRALRDGVGNVRLLTTDAADAVGRLLPAQAVRELIVLFPDPWPKRRHVGRRLLQSAFLVAAHAALEPWGRMHVASDHDALWPWIEQRFAELPLLFRPEAAFGLPLEQVAATNFARKMAPDGAFGRRTYQRLP